MPSRFSLFYNLFICLPTKELEHRPETEVPNSSLIPSSTRFKRIICIEQQYEILFRQSLICVKD